MDYQHTMTEHPFERVTLPIYGLTCRSGGELTIERAIQRIQGVRYVYVNPATEMAYVEYDPLRCTLEALASAVRKSGFHAGIPMPR